MNGNGNGNILIHTYVNLSLPLPQQTGYPTHSMLTSLPLPLMPPPQCEHPHWIPLDPFMKEKILVCRCRCRCRHSVWTSLKEIECSLAVAAEVWTNLYFQNMNIIISGHIIKKKLSFHSLHLSTICSVAGWCSPLNNYPYLSVCSRTIWSRVIPSTTGFPYQWHAPHHISMDLRAN